MHMICSDQSADARLLSGAGPSGRADDAKGGSSLTRSHSGEEGLSSFREMESENYSAGLPETKVCAGMHGCLSLPVILRDCVSAIWVKNNPERLTGKVFFNVLHVSDLVYNVATESESEVMALLKGWQQLSRWQKGTTGGTGN